MKIRILTFAKLGFLCFTPFFLWLVGYVSIILSKYIYIFKFAEAYDSLDPTGNITIKWDVMQWTPDGYVVSA